MIEAVEVIRKLVDIGTQTVRRQILIGVFHDGVELGDVQHQRLFLCALGFADLYRKRCRAAALRVLVQDRLDPDNGVQDVRAGVALEGRKALDIKDIILGGLVGEVSVL